MAKRKRNALAAGSRSAPQVVSPRNRVNVALPFSRFTVEEPMKMTVGDWVSLAGLVISVAGFSVVIWQSFRAPNTPEAGQASHRAG